MDASIDSASVKVSPCICHRGIVSTDAHRATITREHDSTRIREHYYKETDDIDQKNEIWALNSEIEFTSPSLSF